MAPPCQLEPKESNRGIMWPWSIPWALVALQTQSDVTLNSRIQGNYDGRESKLDKSDNPCIKYLTES